MAYTGISLGKECILFTAFYTHLTLQSPYPLALLRYRWHVHLAFTQYGQNQEVVLV